ncbi:MAG: flagellar biosynthesis anti-sigma factor FlgM [Bdellovibrionales bacterium]|jgi:negative regulator of flagellin synthesis FlgM|nr:flagellar biosynthesis anti-sigma factor FlgM [Bdellovibrionales bacterium]
MSKITKPKERSFFFPKKRETITNTKNKLGGERSNIDSGKQLKRDNLIQRDTNVTINDGIKDFSKIKRYANLAPDIDNSQKIASLKEQIANGTYKVDLDALADSIMDQKF